VATSRSLHRDLPSEISPQKLPCASMMVIGFGSSTSLSRKRKVGLRPDNTFRQNRFVGVL